MPVYIFIEKYVAEKVKANKLGFLGLLEHYFFNFYYNWFYLQNFVALIYGVYLLTNCITYLRQIRSITANLSNTVIGRDAVPRNWVKISLQGFLASLVSFTQIVRFLNAFILTTGTLTQCFLLPLVITYNLKKEILKGSVLAQLEDGQIKNIVKQIKQLFIRTDVAFIFNVGVKLFINVFNDETSYLTNAERTDEFYKIIEFFVNTKLEKISVEKWREALENCFLASTYKLDLPYFFSKSMYVMMRSDSLDTYTMNDLTMAGTTLNSWLVLTGIIAPTQLYINILDLDEANTFNTMVAKWVFKRILYTPTIFCIYCKVYEDINLKISESLNATKIAFANMLQNIMDGNDEDFELKDHNKEEEESNDELKKNSNYFNSNEFTDFLEDGEEGYIENAHSTVTEDVDVLMPGTPDNFVTEDEEEIDTNASECLEDYKDNTI